MNKRCAGMKKLCCIFVCLGLLLGAGAAIAGSDDKPVNLILKNDSSNSLQVELIDQYGGNFTITLEPGTSQNQALKMNSKVIVGGKSVHVATAKDDGKEVVIGK
ncbi:MAG: hypothetical protein V2B20_14100 [Pseudomonadota bacterium]